MTATERRRDLLDEIAWLHSELHGAELESSKATSVLHAIDRLRRELSGYHGQLKAYDDLKAHCDNQRRRINELEGLYARLKEENAKLRELVRDAWGNGHPDKSCGDCEIRDECHAEIEEAHKEGGGRWNTRCLFERRIEERMEELGVEQ